MIGSKRTMNELIYRRESSVWSTFVFLVRLLFITDGYYGKDCEQRSSGTWHLYSSHVVKIGGKSAIYRGFTGPITGSLTMNFTAMNRAFKKNRGWPLKT